MFATLVGGVARNAGAGGVHRDRKMCWSQGAKTLLWALLGQSYDGSLGGKVESICMWREQQLVR